MDNPELKDMFEKDQNSRFSEDIDWSVVSKEDDQRRVRVLELIEEEKLITGADYYHAAMIFQHGSTEEEYERANSLAKKSMELGEPRAPWLCAASLDRWLLQKGEPVQKFGTQFQKEPEGEWYLCPVDPTTTDEDRAKYNVPSLEKQKERLKKLNA